MRAPRALALAIATVIALLLAACDDGTDGDASTADDDELSGELVVFAAASLTDAFDDVGDAFTAAHPEVSITFNYAGSSSLAASITEGAPADVFASANPAEMANVVDAGLAPEDPPTFARNGLQIVVPADNPAGVEGLEDFAEDDLLIGLCAEEAPCGALARDLLEAQDVAPAIDTNEPDVRALLTKVETGELDAGLVYRTDARSAGGAITAIDVPGADDVVSEYPIVALSEAPNRDAAEAFVDFVLSEEGQAILDGHGFLAP